MLERNDFDWISGCVSSFADSFLTLIDEMSCKQSTMKLFASSSFSISSIDCAGLVLFVALLLAVLIVSVLVVVAELVPVVLKLLVLVVFVTVAVLIAFVLMLLLLVVVMVAVVATLVVVLFEPKAAEGGAEEMLVPV